MVKPHCCLVSCFTLKTLLAGRRLGNHYMYGWNRASGSKLMTPCSLMLPRSRDGIVPVPLLLQSTMREGRRPHKRQLLALVTHGRHPSQLKRLLQAPVRCEKQTSSTMRAFARAKGPARDTFHFPLHPSAANTLTWQLLSFVSVHSLKTLYSLHL